MAVLVYLFLRIGRSDAMWQPLQRSEAGWLRRVVPRSGRSYLRFSAILVAVTLAVRLYINQKASPAETKLGLI
jgi:hypothetical protein